MVESPAPAFRPPWRPCSSGSWITSRHGAQAAMAAVHLGLAHLLEFRSHTFRSPAFGPVRRRTLIVCQVCPLAAMAAIGEPDAGPGPGPGKNQSSITKYGQSGFPPLRRTGNRGFPGVSVPDTSAHDATASEPVSDLLVLLGSTSVATAASPSLSGMTTADEERACCSRCL